MKFKTSRTLPINLEEYVEYTHVYKEKSKDVNMEPIGLENY